MRYRPIVVSLCVASLFSLASRADAQTTRPRTATAAKPAQEAGWLANPIREEPSPEIVSLKGVGTASAVAEARMAPKAIEAYCTENVRLYTSVAACQKQMQTQYAKTLRATADCTLGRITTTADLTYTLDGLWDNSDIGGGRTRWRDSDGVVVGRGLADNGLYVSQQWETLCPAPVTAAFIARATQAAAARPAAAQARPASQNPSICGGEPLCTEVNDFAVTIIDFRASLVAPRKVLTVSYRFENKTTRPIVLGYLPGSGVAIDERGNRYASVDTDVRGIGLISRTVDAKFVLQPGQRSDARLAYYWDGGRAAYGTTFDVELTVREIRDLGNNKVDLGAEYPLRLAGLVDGARPGMSSPASSSAAPPAAAPVASAPAAAPTEQVDNCAGSRNPCHDAGAFSTTVTALSGSMYGNRHHILTIQLAIRNHSDQPLVLAYKSGTNSGIDNLGNAYGWGRPGTYDGSVKGIGIVIPGRSSDSQFRLAPGASRNAVVTVTRYESGPNPQGQSFTLDTVLAELRILPNGNQTEIVREHSVHLAGLTLGGRAVGTSSGSGDEAAERIKKAGEAIRGIFGGRK